MIFTVSVNTKEDAGLRRMEFDVLDGIADHLEHTIVRSSATMTTGSAKEALDFVKSFEIDQHDVHISMHGERRVEQQIKMLEAFAAIEAQPAQVGV